MLKIKKILNEIKTEKEILNLYKSLKIKDSYINHCDEQRIETIFEIDEKTRIEHNEFFQGYTDCFVLFFEKNKNWYNGDMIGVYKSSGMHDSTCITITEPYSDRKIKKDININLYDEISNILLNN